MMIGKIAELASVAPSAIRFYEREGLLEPHKIGRCRTYTSSDVETLKSIVSLRKIGLPISKIRDALKLTNNSNPASSRDGVTKILEEQVQELQRMSEVVSEQLQHAVELLREMNDTQEPPAK